MSREHHADPQKKLPAAPSVNRAGGPEGEQTGQEEIARSPGERAPRERSSALRPFDVLALQRSVGNRATNRLLRKDSPPSSVQRAGIRESKPGQPAAPRDQAAPEAVDERGQEAGAMATAARSHPGGLPDDLRVGIETLSGVSMDGVRVHYNSSKPAEVQALAYAQGRDIHVGPGQEQHLAHEAWHVAQQSQGRVRPTVQFQRVKINDDAGLEGEATAMGERALALGTQILAGDVEPGAAPEVGRAASGEQPLQAMWIRGPGVTDETLANPLNALVAYTGSTPGLELFHAQLFDLHRRVSAGEPGTLERIQTWLRQTLTDSGYWTIQGLIDGALRATNDVEDPSDDPDTAEAPAEPIEPEHVDLDAFPPQHPILSRIFMALAENIGITNVPPGVMQQAFSEWYSSRRRFTRSSFRALFQSQEQYQGNVLQPRRLPNTLSSQAQYTTSNFGLFEHVTYRTDAKGNIDFTSPEAHTPPPNRQWQNPHRPGTATVNLNTGCKRPKYGFIDNGVHLPYEVNIPNGNRGQHFAIANTLMGDIPAAHASPAGWTWHHLTPHYEMVQVDREVHRKHGHNGGVLFWT